MLRRSAIALAILAGCSRCASEPTGYDKPYLTEPPPLPIPAFNASGCMTAEQISALNASIQLARTWQAGAVHVIEDRCNIQLRAGDFPDAGYAR